MSNPLVSVIVVNRNGVAFVGDCLEFILNNRYENFELIFVDNNSTDGSKEFVKNRFGKHPKIKIIENPGSWGPARGRNIGIKISQGKYIVFLDNDTQVDADWLIELVKVFEEDDSIGAAQSKLLSMEDKKSFDCAGDYLGPLGFLIERSRRTEDKGQFDYIADILSAKSAASAIRRELLDEIGGFDGDYYMYLEETDLSWRVWLTGKRVVFVPTSIVYHAYGTKKKTKDYYEDYVVRFYGCRNYITTLIKNMSLVYLIAILPLHLTCWVIISFVFLCKGNFLYAYWIIKAIFWHIINLPIILKKRYRIQRMRKVSDIYIMKRVMYSKPIYYYFGKACAYVQGRMY